MTLSKINKITIVGASSGIGQALARHLAAPGRKIALLARSSDKLQALADELNNRVGESVAYVYIVDVTDSGAAEPTLEKIAGDFGGLDLLIYSSGIMSRLDIKTYDTSGDLEMVSVNVAGAISWLNAAARRFAIAKSGTIVGISSVAGDRGRSANPVYGATKSFLDAYLEGLRNRIERSGCTVITIKPGPIETPMTAGLGKMPLMISADAAAEQIIGHIDRGTRVAYVPGTWRFVMTVVRLIPSPIFKYLNF